MGSKRKDQGHFAKGGRNTKDNERVGSKRKENTEKISAVETQREIASHLYGIEIDNFKLYKEIRTIRKAIAIIAGATTFMAVGSVLIQILSMLK